MFVFGAGDEKPKDKVVGAVCVFTGMYAVVFGLKAQPPVMMTEHTTLTVVLGHHVRCVDGFHVGGGRVLHFGQDRRLQAQVHVDEVYGHIPTNHAVGVTVENIRICFAVVLAFDQPDTAHTVAQVRGFGGLTRHITVCSQIGRLDLMPGQSAVLAFFVDPLYEVRRHQGRVAFERVRLDFLPRRRFRCLRGRGRGGCFGCAAR